MAILQHLANLKTEPRHEFLHVERSAKAAGHGGLGLLTGVVVGICSAAGSRLPGAPRESRRGQLGTSRWPDHLDRRLWQGRAIAGHPRHARMRRPGIPSYEGGSRGRACAGTGCSGRLPVGGNARPADLSAIFAVVHRYNTAACRYAIHAGYVHVRAGATWDLCMPANPDGSDWPCVSCVAAGETVRATHRGINVLARRGFPGAVMVRTLPQPIGAFGPVLDGNGQFTGPSSRSYVRLTWWRILNSIGRVARFSALSGPLAGHLDSIPGWDAKSTARARQVRGLRGWRMLAGRGTGRCSTAHLAGKTAWRVCQWAVDSDRGLLNHKAARPGPSATTRQCTGSATTPRPSLPGGSGWSCATNRAKQNPRDK